jgi:two-component system, sensor histidine kinase
LCFAAKRGKTNGLTCWLPACYMNLPGETRAVEKEPNEIALNGRALDVLVVDDNRLNLIALDAALAETFVNVVQAQSGDAALRMLLDRDFALILLDVQMPTLDGFETAKLIRQRARTRNTPIIFVTAHDRADEDVLRAYELGAVDFMTKPIVPEVLRAKALVFANLRLQHLEVERQALLLRKHERREHERLLDDERRRWEAEALRRVIEEERKASLALEHKANELSRTVRELESVKAELTHLNTELATSDQRKTEFIAVLAHELRNPLAPIVASLELVKEGVRESSAPLEAKAFQIIERQTGQLVRLVDDLLDVSRITSGRIELRKAPTRLHDIIEQAIATSRPAIDQANHTLHVDMPDAELTLVADPVRMVQVLSNLLNNSARYTDRGGTIHLSVKHVDQLLRLTVVDNGRGMSEKTQLRVFDMFAQETPGKGGLGVGLTLVKRLVELHDGHVTAASPGPGLGSTFVIELPLVPRPAEPKATPPAPPVAPIESLHIVLVEDNPDIRESIRALLTIWGHRVEEAATGPSGVELIVRTRPDLAFVDIGLPEIDGCEVAVRVRQQSTRKLRLFAMSGYGQEGDRKRIIEAGFDGLIVKPADANALKNALSSVRLNSVTA